MLVTMLPRASNTVLRYLLILDFEATCWEGGQSSGREIIEFPTLLYNLKEKKVEDTFHNYIRPVLHPTLSEFCTSLTGITQDVVNAAEPFPPVWRRFNGFLEKHGVFNDPSSYAFLTCGDWDLKTMLPEQISYYDTAQRSAMPSLRALDPIKRINVKRSFQTQYDIRHMKGMEGMLNRLKLPLEGKHHSGIDDCKNIARIVARMQIDGWKPGPADFSRGNQL